MAPSQNSLREINCIDFNQILLPRYNISDIKSYLTPFFYTIVAPKLISTFTKNSNFLLFLFLCDWLHREVKFFDITLLGLFKIKMHVYHFYCLLLYEKICN